MIRRNFFPQFLLLLFFSLKLVVENSECLLQISNNILQNSNNASSRFTQRTSEELRIIEEDGRRLGRRNKRNLAAWAGQCPSLANFDHRTFQSSASTSRSLLGDHWQLPVEKQFDRVQEEPGTGVRSFQARIVGIFSCLDQLQQSSRGGASGGGSEESSSGGGYGGGNAADLTLDFRLAKPVIDLAVRAVNSKYPNIRFNVTYRTGADVCRHQQAAGQAADEFYMNGANFFLGPGCSESLASVGQLASYWNVPMCSTGYLPEMVTARFKPLTLMQLSLSVQSVGEMLLELFQMYKWRHLVIVTDEKHPLHSLIRDGLLEFFHTLYMLSGSSSSSSSRASSSLGSAATAGSSAAASNTLPAGATSNQQQQQQSDRFGGHAHSRGGTHLPYYINITSRNFAYTKDSSSSSSSSGSNSRAPNASAGGGLDYEQIMLDAASYSRVMLLLARSSTIANLLEAAHNQGMSKGQFVFIAHELFETQMFESSSSSSSAADGANATPANSDFSGQYTPTSGTQINKHQKFSLDDKIEPIQSLSGLHHLSSQTVTNSTQPLSNSAFSLGAGSLNGGGSGGGSGSSATETLSEQDLTREIFQPLMTISLRIPTTQEFDTFRAEVASLSEREFNYRVQPSSLKSLYSLGVAALIYDCVMLYADKVDYVLKETNFQRIDGKTIFDLSAGKTFRSALTGDLTINRAGQRVIDFTLNDFSPKTLQLEPIAHFMAIERRLAFLPGKKPHWMLRNQSTPRSDPRCRLTDLFCRYTDLTDGLSDLDGLGGVPGAGNYPDRFVIGVWLLVIIVLSVTLTSSIIGWLVYRRFRIESELLNLWWSIKYEDILFEDELCDGKRSMSSLAISNESFNERSPQNSQKHHNTRDRLNSLSGAKQDLLSGGVASELDPSQNGGVASLLSPHMMNTENGNNTLLPIDNNNNNNNNTSTNTNTGGVACAGNNNKQLSVCHSLGQDGQTVLSTAQSTSTLSVTAPSLAGSNSSLAMGGAAQSVPNSRSAIMMQNLNSGVSSKLTPLISRPANASSPAGSGTGVRQRSRTTHANASKSSGGTSKFSGSNIQLGAGGNTKIGRGGGVAVGGGGAGGGVGALSMGANKDPSISSQNKNVKLRLGTILNGGRGERNTTKVGMYKASRVAVKHMNVRNLNISRQLLIELRQVRDLTHENLIKFIGLCPEEPNVAVVSELCTRGNLQDLLQNETIRLDWPFRYSIINDIVDGLIHLHSSAIQYHGRLKSSNCVIDNRFVVKLTDFGLPTLLGSVEMTDEEVNPRLLLWTAPEHLRTKNPLLSGSQKGDIYGLAIIFQEIITRCGPFECEPILCGASEVQAPLDWHSSGAAACPLPPVAFQPVAPPPPLIRTTDAGGRPLHAGGGGGSGNRGRGAGTAPMFAADHHHRARRTGGVGDMGAHQQQFIAGPVSTGSASNMMMMGVPQAATAPLFQPIVVQHKQRLEPEEIVNLVRMGLSPPFRPYFRPDVAVATAGATATHSVAPGLGNVAAAPPGTEQSFNVGELIAIVQSCWQESPQARPSVVSVKQQIKKMRRGCHLDGANLMDNLLQRMERYTDNLESLVEQKTAELMEEKKRSEELLYEMLPRFVVDQLKYGHSVTPEAYEAVTISFSDIKDFTSIAAQSSPIEVVNLLNQLYTEFDDCIARYDVYKVETIGDAYMVVSGLPVRNGDQHAREIAEMSLGLLELIRNFHLVHLPHVKLELRIGIHSGPCASGVVGTRMFRYCLFGDTVNTASRMESHGEPMKIHISEDSAIILRKFDTFVIEPRGQIEIKGKGLMNTFWLAGKVGGRK